MRDNRLSLLLAFIFIFGFSSCFSSKNAELQNALFSLLGGDFINNDLDKVELTIDGLKSIHAKINNDNRELVKLKKTLTVMRNNYTKMEAIYSRNTLNSIIQKTTLAGTIKLHIKSESKEYQIFKSTHEAGTGFYYLRVDLVGDPVGASFLGFYEKNGFLSSVANDGEEEKSADQLKKNDRR